MFEGIFPCCWIVPGRKPIHPKTIRITRPVSVLVKVAIPTEEMCLGEVNDFTEIDQMLKELDNPSENTKSRQIMQTISMVSESLKKNIEAIEQAPVVSGDSVTKEDLLTMLRGFANYSRILENYIKEIKPLSV